MANSARKRRRDRINLPANCSRSHISVYPFNWEESRVSTKDDWYIQFYFYDPEKYPKGKLVIKKGMNEFKSVLDRRTATRTVIAYWEELMDRGYDPITGKFNIIESIERSPGDILPNDSLQQALDIAFNKLKKIKGDTRTNIKSMLKYFMRSAKDLKFDTMEISRIRPKHLRLILENCDNKKIKQNWTPHIYNHYRTYLMMLFKEIRKMEAIEMNPVLEIEKEEAEHKPREILTNDEALQVLEAFKHDVYYTRFLHIFFHSGDRPIELLQIKKEDVNTSTWIYRITVRKGRKTRTIEKPIKDIAIKYWVQQLSECMPGQFLFGRNLKPGTVPSSRCYVTNKWLEVIKGRNQKNKPVTQGIGINKDLYSLKHKNLDEIASFLSAEEARKAAGHSSKVITLNHYLVGEKQRENEKIRKVQNEFGG